VKRRDSLLCALALSALAAGQAAQADPFALRDQNPLIHGVYLPLGRPALPADRSARQDLTLTFSNTTNIDRNRGEELLVDGETTELRWSAAWPLGERWQLQASIPMVHYEGGHLDSMIDDWHRLLGLPRGDRPARPENRLDFYYGLAGSSVDVTEGHTGLGDAAIEVAYTMLATDQSTLNLWVGMEFPIGERSALLGNGSVDAAIWLSGARQLAEHWQLDATLGITRPGSVEPLPLAAPGAIPFGSVALSWEGAPAYGLTLQIDAHGSCVEDSDLDFLGSAALLTVGGHFLFASGWRFELAVTEDLRPGASPDIVFYFALRHQR
jgi:uncharacterized protein DUF3187